MSAATVTLAKASAAVAKAEADVEAANVAEVAATEAYDFDPGKHAQALAARLAHERASRLLVKRQAEEVEARAAVEAEERATMASELVKDRAVLARLKEEVEPFVLAILAADAAVDDAALGVALLVAERLSVYARAVDSAHVLGERTDDLPKPDFAEVRLDTRRRLRDARGASGRDDLSASWLASASGDWRQATMTAAEVASYERASADARKHDERARDVRRGMVAALGVAPPPPAPVTPPAPQPAPVYVPEGE